MRYFLAICFIFIISSSVYASGKIVSYNVDGKWFEGYFVSPSPDTPLILMIHDWDCLKKI